MNSYDAVGIVEGHVDCESDEQYIEALQYLIDTGLCWKLQGYFGRVALMAIQRGDCNPPKGYRLNANGKLEAVEQSE